jgi:hypothetical protein
MIPVPISQIDVISVTKENYIKEDKEYMIYVGDIKL